MISVCSSEINCSKSQLFSSLPLYLTGQLGYSHYILLFFMLSLLDKTVQSKVVAKIDSSFENYPDVLIFINDLNFFNHSSFMMTVELFEYISSNCFSYFYSIQFLSVFLFSFQASYFYSLSLIFFFLLLFLSFVFFFFFFSSFLPYFSILLFLSSSYRFSSEK